MLHVGVCVGLVEAGQADVGGQAEGTVWIVDDFDFPRPIDDRGSRFKCEQHPDTAAPANERFSAGGRVLAATFPGVVID